MLVLFPSVLVPCVSGHACHESNSLYQVRIFGLPFSSSVHFKPWLHFWLRCLTYYPLPSSHSSKVSTVGEEDVLQQIWNTRGQNCQLCLTGHMHWTSGIYYTSVLGACFLVENPLCSLQSVLIFLRSSHQKGKPLIHFSQFHIWKMPLSNIFTMVG